MNSYDFSHKLVRILESEKPTLSIAPFRHHDYGKVYFQEGMPVLVGLTSRLIKLEFSSGDVFLPEKFVALLNNGEKKLDTRDVSYPAV